MSVKIDSWWVEEKEYNIENLDYNKVIEILIKSWNAEKDKDLKLRYGYQLVRLAHYKANYEEAINYFNSHVESLNYKLMLRSSIPESSKNFYF